MKTPSTLLPYLTTALAGSPTDGPKKKFRAKPEKKCLECGKKHKHNNCYCSAECCKTHRTKGKE